MMGEAVPRLRAGVAPLSSLVLATSRRLTLAASLVVGFVVVTGLFVRASCPAWMVLAGGLLLVGLLGALLLVATRQDARVAEAEAMYRDLHDNAPDMYVAVSPDTARVLDCNQTLATALGYRKEEIIGRLIFDLYHPDCLDQARATFESFVRTGEVSDAELQLARRDGGTIEVSLNVTAIRDTQGKILRSRVTWRDIGARKQLERWVGVLEQRAAERTRELLPP